MKKRILIVLTSLLLVSAIFAFDFGLNIYNNTSFSKHGTSNTFLQSNTASAWFNQKGIDYEVAVAAKYTFNYLKIDTFSQIDYGIFDLDYAYYLQTVSFDTGLNSLGLQVGRFLTKDMLSNVFNAKFDGVKVGFDLNDFNIGVQTFYTGLLLNKTSPVKMSDLDVFYSQDEKRIFGTSRIIYSLNAVLENFAFRQSAALEFVGQNDINERSVEYIDTYYVGLGFRGPVVQALSYNVSTIYELANTETGADHFMLVDGKINYVVPEVNGAFFVGGLFPFTFGTSALLFRPITEKTVSFTNSSITASTAQTVSVGGTFKFKVPLSLSVVLQNYFIPSNTQTTLLFVDPSKTGKYLGFETDATLNFMPTSEFALSLSGGFLLLNKGIVTNDTAATAFKISLLASIFI